jgi:integrase
MLTTVRAYLIFAGCKAARTWKFPYRARQAVNGIFLSEVDVAAIRQYARPLGTETELIYSLGVDNGLRSIDMRRLTIKNAHELLHSHHSTILGKGRGGGKPGHLELSRMTERPLVEYITRRQEWARTAPKDSDRLIVLPTPEGLRPVSEDYISNKITRLSEASGIHFRTHDLRRTYGHRLHLAGVPIETIARLMRHESINQSFKAYIGILGDELRAAQDRLNCP